MNAKKPWNRVRTELNPATSPSSGNVVTYEGKDPGWRNGPHWFMRIQDCGNSVCFHPTPDESLEDFIRKLKTLEKAVSSFRKHLEKLD